MVRAMQFVTIYSLERRESPFIRSARNGSNCPKIVGEVLSGAPISTGRHLSALPDAVDAFAHDLVGWIAMDRITLFRRFRRAAARRGYRSRHPSRVGSPFFPSALFSFGHWSLLPSGKVVLAEIAKARLAFSLHLRLRGRSHLPIAHLRQVP
jgi:hypothetical protein